MTITGAGFTSFAQSANFAAALELPTNLGGVSVTFNGAPAAIAYAAPTQINALAPASLQPGPIQVVVTLNGVPSAPFPLTAKATQPAIYAVPDASGATYFVTAVLEGTATLVGNSAVDPRVTRAVLPGDVIDLYMIGLGATSDPAAFVTNQEFSGAFPVSAPVAATGGGEPATVIFASLTAPGQYLVRIAVPSDIKPGQQPIVVSTGDPAAGGAQTSPHIALTIGTPGPNLMRDGTFNSPLSALPAQTALQLHPGQVYRLSFRARAIAPTALNVALAGVTTEVSLTTGWRQYVAYFRVPEDATDTQLNLGLVDGTGKVLLDGIALVGASQ